MISKCIRCGHPAGFYEGVCWHVRLMSDGRNWTITAMGCRAASRLRTGKHDDSLPKRWQAELDGESEPVVVPGQQWTIEGLADVTFEDGNQACIAHIDGDEDVDDGIFVRFQSWQTEGRREDHPMMDLQGHRVRVEITVLD
jgi:hypothetical protein